MSAPKSRFGLQLKVLLMVGSLISSSALYFVLSTLSARANVASLRQGAGQVFPTLQAADAGIFLVERLRESLNAAVGTRELDELKNADGLATEIRAGFGRIRAHDPDSVAQAEKLLLLFESYYGQARQLAQQLISGKADLGAPETLKASAAMQVASADFTSVLKAFRAQRNADFVQSIDASATRTDRIITLGYALMALCLFVLAIISLRLRRDVIHPIEDLTRLSQAVSNGGYPAVPTRAGGDEIATLFRNFGAMIGDLKANHERLAMIARKSRELSGAPTIPWLAAAVATAFGELAGGDLDVDVVFARHCFLDAALSDGYYRVGPDGTPLAAPVAAAPEAPAALGHTIRVVDPRTQEQLAAVAVRMPAGMDPARTLPSLEALAVSIADALAAIRLEKAMQLLDAKTRKIRSVFGAISQGICTIDQDLRLGPEYSTHLTRLLGRREFAGVPFSAAILDKLQLPADRKSAITFLLEAGIGGDRSTFDLNAHVLPREVVSGEGGQRTHLEVDWIPICDHADTILEMMVTLRDVTEVRRLRDAAASRSLDAAVIEQLLLSDPRRFAGFAAEAAAAFAVSARLAAAPQAPEAAELVGLKRSLHTLKGNSRGLGLALLAERLHELESCWMRLGRAAPAGDAALARSQGDVSTLFDRYRELNDKIGRRGATGATGPAATDAWVGLRAVAKDAHTGLAQVCAVLGEAVPELALVDPGCLVPARLEPVLVGVFTHLMRNSVDHGLRGQERKTISLDARPGPPGRWELVYADSGRGLNVRALRALRERRGEGRPGETVEEVAGSIFASGVSTAPSVTEVSGRGVGMDAARTAMETAGGSLSLRLLGGEDRDGYCRCAFVLGFAGGVALVTPLYLQSA